MIIVMQAGTAQADLDRVVSRVEALRLRPGFEPALLALARLEPAAARPGGPLTSPSLP